MKHILLSALILLAGATSMAQNEAFFIKEEVQRLELQSLQLKTMVYEVEDQLGVPLKRLTMKPPRSAFENKGWLRQAIQAGFIPYKTELPQSDANESRSRIVLINPLQGIAYILFPEDFSAR